MDNNKPPCFLAAPTPRPSQMRDFHCPFCGLRFWKASLTTLTSPGHTENDCPLHNQKRTSLHKSGNPAPTRRARRCKQSRHSRRRRSVQAQRHHLESLLLAYDEAGMRASGCWRLLSPPGTCRRRQASRHHEVQNATEESTPLEQSAPMNLTSRPIMTRASRDLKRRISFQVQSTSAQPKRHTRQEEPRLS
jgi:hypothetical protein